MQRSDYISNIAFLRGAFLLTIGNWVFTMDETPDPSGYGSIPILSQKNMKTGEVRYSRQYGSNKSMAISEYVHDGTHLYLLHYSGELWKFSIESNSPPTLIYHFKTGTYDRPSMGFMLYYSNSLIVGWNRFVTRISVDGELLWQKEVDGSQHGTILNGKIYCARIFCEKVSRLDIDGNVTEFSHRDSVNLISTDGTYLYFISGFHISLMKDDGKEVKTYKIPVVRGKPSQGRNVRILGSWNRGSQHMESGGLILGIDSEQIWYVNSIGMNPILKNAWNILYGIGKPQIVLESSDPVQKQVKGALICYHSFDQSNVTYSSNQGSSHELASLTPTYRVPISFSTATHDESVQILTPTSLRRFEEEMRRKEEEIDESYRNGSGFTLINSVVGSARRMEDIISDWSIPPDHRCHTATLTWGSYVGSGERELKYVCSCGDGSWSLGTADPDLISDEVWEANEKKTKDKKRSMDQAQSIGNAPLPPMVSEPCVPSSPVSSSPSVPSNPSCVVGK